MSIRARRPYLKDHIKTKVQTLELQTPPITASSDCDVVVTSEDSVNSDDVLEGSSLEIPQAEVSAAQEYDKYYDSRVISIMIQVWMRRWYSQNYFIDLCSA